jgi:ribonucleoside-diphosphate reductase beta chain
MSNILGSRDYYKPLEYPWAFDGYKAMQKMHWLPEEVPLHDDVTDWNSKLTEAERNLLTQLFRFFTQADVDVAGGYRTRYQPAFGGHPEVAMMLSCFATSEANHIDAYSLLLDTIGMPELEYKAFQDYAAMREKHEYLFGSRHADLDEKAKLALDVAIFSAFGEGMQLFSSFAMLLSFPVKRGVMKGMGTIVEWSIKDESHHVECMVKLFHAFIRENQHLWTDDFKGRIYQAARDMVDLEDRFIDLAFEQGGIATITAEEVKRYVRYIADRRLNQLGLKSNYGVEENPFPWLEDLLALRVHTNFFEGRATEYRKGGIEGWDEVWGKPV